VRRHDLVVSVDTKKKELVGSFDNRGRRWRPMGDPEPVNVHDFPGQGVGKAIPYGTYDVSRDEAFVNVGITHETAEFAVESIRRWWQLLRRKACPQARRLLDLRGCGRQQWLAAARLETPSAGLGGSAEDDRVPLSSRHEQVEQGGTSLIFVYQYELARSAAAQL